MNLLSKMERDRCKWFSQGINEGKILLVPAETVYCICFDPTRPDVLERALQVKNRVDRKFISLTYDTKRLGEMGIVPNALEQAFIDRFWPGPLAIAFDDDRAIRCPVTPWLREALLKVCTPCVAATSANLSGMPATAEARSLDLTILKNVDDALLDDHMNIYGKPSTLVRLKDKVEILRRGATLIPQELIDASCKNSISLL
jgi:L-threonylcarbamoyladenylate synthase